MDYKRKDGYSLQNAAQAKLPDQFAGAFPGCSVDDFGAAVTGGGGLCFDNPCRRAVQADFFQIGADIVRVPDLYFALIRRKAPAKSRNPRRVDIFYHCNDSGEWKQGNIIPVLMHPFHRDAGGGGLFDSHHISVSTLTWIDDFTVNPFLRKSYYRLFENP